MSTAHSRSGFTLIELLVVMAIIAILTVIGLVAYTMVGPRARDVARKQDLRNIAQALDIYYQANKHYPRTAGLGKTGEYYLSSAGGFWINDTGTLPVVSLNVNYIDAMPRDPKADGGNAITATGASTTTGYVYWSGVITCTGWPEGSNPEGGQYFILGATLENQGDADRNGTGLNRKYKDCTNANISSNDNGFFVTSP